MFIKKPLGLAIAALVFAPVGAYAEIEVSAVLKNETAVFAKSGQTIGEANNVLDTDGHSSGDLMKFENSARVFINGDLGEDSSWHAELRPVYDTEGVNSDYKGHKNYTQNDWFRELYADTSFGGWDLRLGKQQVVWGTADGIKLLDIINPTDFRELNQNGVEDARIPVWMINAERYFDNGGNLQVIISQAEENKIPGLNSDGDAGHPFIMKGVETITGEVNGFMNIAPALSNVAGTFSAGALLGGFAASGAPASAGLTPFTALTVEGFALNMVDTISTPGAFLFPADAGYNAANALPGYMILNNLAQVGFAPGDPNGNDYQTNLMSVSGTGFTDTSWNSSNPTAAFEWMSNATFATFNSFSNCNDGDGGGCDNIFHPVGNPGGTDSLTGGVSTEYVRDYPSGSNPNAGFRWRNSTDGGLNYSLNYFYHYGANPQVNLSWHDATNGQSLKVIRAAQVDPLGLDADPFNNFVANPDPTASLGVNDLPNNVTIDGAGNATNSTSMLLFNPKSGAYYGPIDPSTGAINANPNGSVLRFTESTYRVNSFGASFDYSLDTGFAPVVLRGEFLYDKGEKQPVVDKRLLAAGDLATSLKMEEADIFKYVVGVDVTVMTNLLVSGQFIQFRNLDYVDEQRTCTTQFGNRYDCSRYTADFSTLNMYNGLNKGWKNKEFYSLFLSKPIGESQLGRVNNIIIYEEGGGYWDRLDAEYSLSDQLVLTGEINMYWGDENTTFGQFENSSNIQIGMKYIIE